VADAAAADAAAADAAAEEGSEGAGSSAAARLAARAAEKAHPGREAVTGRSYVKKEKVRRTDAAEAGAGRRSWVQSLQGGACSAEGLRVQ